MKRINGKAIYSPKGKAGEYAEYACNFYVGCSNRCEYCYCKKGILAGTMGGDTPTLKKCFKDEYHAFEVFENELMCNLPELQKHGIFFSFTTDPFLPETVGLTTRALVKCMERSVPVKILTKKVNWVTSTTVGWNLYSADYLLKEKFKKYLAIGFTLTGHDELEPGASTNAERIDAMRMLHEAGFKTFASIEPVINFADSLSMIEKAQPFCDLFKIGLKAGDQYRFEPVIGFIESAITAVGSSKVYFKDSVLKQAKLERSMLPRFCVGADYNMFED